jgi:16S rRNA (guanine(966)-N(2))-methyltransferase RsmD
VLDLFAGSGALGAEALSRGAASAVFVERSSSVLACLRENLVALGLDGSSRTVAAPARAALGRLASEGECFDLVFLDPPYAAGELEGALLALVAKGLLLPHARVVAEAPRRHPPGEIAGLERADERAYGETVVVRYISEPPGPDAPEGRKSTQ